MSFRTSAAADDIEDVRKALGFGRIALYGDSYAPSSASRTRTAIPDRSARWCSTRPIHSRARTRGTRAFLAPGVRSLSIACEALGGVLGRRGQAAREADAASPGHGARTRVDRRDLRGRLRVRRGQVLPRHRRGRAGAARGRPEAVAQVDRGGQARVPPSPLLRARRGARGRLQRLPDDLGTSTRTRRSGASSWSGQFASTTRTPSSRSPRARSRSHPSSATSSARPGRRRDPTTSRRSPREPRRPTCRPWSYPGSSTTSRPRSRGAGWRRSSRTRATTWPETPAT